MSLVSCFFSDWGVSWMQLIWNGTPEERLDLLAAVQRNGARGVAERPVVQPAAAQQTMPTATSRARGTVTPAGAGRLLGMGVG